MHLSIKQDTTTEALIHHVLLNRTNYAMQKQALVYSETRTLEMILSLPQGWNTRKIFISATFQQITNAFSNIVW